VPVQTGALVVMVQAEADTTRRRAPALTGPDDL
jgi:hypothetical protein